MTVNEAIAAVDEAKPNRYSYSTKVGWLNSLDTTVMEQVVDTHEPQPVTGFAGYNESTPGDTKLLLPPPHDEAYLWWLMARIDYYNGDFDRYNNTSAMFNLCFRSFASHYHRTHTPKAARLWFY